MRFRRAPPPPRVEDEEPEEGTAITLDPKNLRSSKSGSRFLGSIVRRERRARDEAGGVEWMFAWVEEEAVGRSPYWALISARARSTSSIPDRSG